jgi:hypothetical protein
MDVTAAKQSQRTLEQAFREIKTLKDRLQSENIVMREEIDKASMFEQIVGTLCGPYLALFETSTAPKRREPVENSAEIPSLQLARGGNPKHCGVAGPGRYSFRSAFIGSIREAWRAGI